MRRQGRAPSGLTLLAKGSLVALAVAPLLPGSAGATPITPVADSYIDESAPTTHFGTSTSFRTDGSPILTAYLRFNVQGVGPTDSVTLRVFAETANSLGFRVHSVSDNTWSETGLDYTNAPSFGPVVDFSGPVLAGTWSSVDVSSIVPTDGPVSLALTSESATATRFSSREGSNPPQLIIEGSSPPPSSYLVTREGDMYRATPQGAGTTYTGTLKQVMQSAVQDLHSAGGGTVTFTSGVFDFGSEFLVGSNLANITFQGQGMDVTVLQNNSSAAIDTEAFDMHDTNQITVRDMTVIAGGPFRSTSDALDFDGGNDVVIERVKITGSRGRGIVFDGKDFSGPLPRTADRNVVRDCVITGIPSDGIELLASSRNHIEGCSITDVGGHGIQITKSSTMADQSNKKSDDNVLVGNSIDNSGQDGINLNSGDRNEIRGSTILNSSDDVSGRDGIRLSSADAVNCDDNIVSGNTSGDSQATHTQRYGLNISSSLCSRTVVWQNTFFGNLNGDINDLGTDTRYTAPTDTKAPIAPVNLTATAAGSSRVDLSWQASSDNVGVTRYEIFRDGSLHTTVGAVTSYSDTTVSPSTTYSYQVRARDAVGNRSGFSNPATVTTPVPAAADLALTKTDPPGRAPTGRNMTYTLTVNNHGPDAASGLTVVDQLPSSVTFVSATLTQGTCGESGGTVKCNLGTIGSGAMATIDIVVKPTVPGTITNTASVSSSTPDPNEGNNADSEVTSICRITSRRSSIPCG
ncbi:MAG TPA: right-handed parallel beta-helix repeat-containing protein [Actinomycetota bacterium]|nr:right-handed parallel beta-helix repeat-containing protein [Actinomycetota bacterium]